MTRGEITPSQLQLMKARATRFSQYKQQTVLSAEHGTVAKEIDQCLAYGLLKHGYDETLPGELSASIFVPYNKCLTICMENGIQQNKESCDICDNIGDLTKHSSVCMGHPEACSTCKSFFNLLEYHLLSCHTCDMHLCTRLKLKLMKYHSTVEGGLVDLWPKIQQYISRLYPAAATYANIYCNSYQATFVGKIDPTRYPSVFDSVPATPPSPKSPALVARGPEQEQAVASDGAHNVAGISTFGREWEWEYQMDMDDFASKFGDSMGIQSRPPSSSQYTVAAAAPFDPSAIAGDVFMSTDLSSFGSLTLNSLESKLKMNDGYGAVITGEPRQLRQLAQYWDTLKKRLAASNNSRTKSFRTEVDGVLLKGVKSGMHVIGGQYKKNEQWRKITYVGSGVAGKCYLAVDIQTEAQFAVKKIDLLKYQSDELELWSELEHPNLVQLFGAIRVKNKVYIFSEFYAAGNLAEYIEGRQMLDQWISLWFLSQLLDSLQYLSRKNILHEDIKADNIFLKPDSYKVGLGDFGLSRKGKCPPNEKPVGGQHHWSPEKAMSEGHGFPADVWAVNCAFVHMLGGEPPWRRRFSGVQFLHYKIAKESPPLEDIPENLQPIVGALIKKAWIVDTSERPTAEELLQDECFQMILYGGYDHTDPLFRSHFPPQEEEGDIDMEFESYEQEQQFSFDALLDGMDDKDQATAYLNHLCSTLDEEDFELPPLAAAANVTTPIRRQHSIKPPPMESIVEEIDISVNQSEDDSLHLSQKNILERRDMPAISPLVLPKNPPSGRLEKRNSWGRSNTSPSASDEHVLQSRRDTFRKQETSPAIIISSGPGDECLLGEKDIFDLNPNTSGYQTATSYIPSGEAGLSLNFQSDVPNQNLADMSSSWLGTSPSSYWTADPPPISSNSQMNGFTDNNMMGHIPLRAESSAMCAPLPEKFDLSSSLKILRDSLTSSSIEPRCIITIVNGITKIHTSEVLVRGNETWREIIEQNMAKINNWNIDGYTYYHTPDTEEVGLEVSLNEVVPREKTNVYIYPTQENSIWQVRNNKICHVH